MPETLTRSRVAAPPAGVKHRATSPPNSQAAVAVLDSARPRRGICNEFVREASRTNASDSNTRSDGPAAAHKHWFQSQDG